MARETHTIPTTRTVRMIEPNDGDHTRDPLFPRTLRGILRRSTGVLGFKERQILGSGNRSETRFRKSSHLVHRTVK